MQMLTPKVMQYLIMRNETNAEACMIIDTMA